MGFLDLQSFCCGLANLQLGCKIISLATAVYSFAVFAVVCYKRNLRKGFFVLHSHILKGVSYNDLLIAGAAYILLFFALLLLYGVLERVKVLVRQKRVRSTRLTICKTLMVSFLFSSSSCSCSCEL